MTVTVRSNERLVSAERLAAAAEEGRRLAAEGLTGAHANAAASPIEELARSGIPRLREIGIVTEVVRSRRGCLVVRTVPCIEGYEAEACSLVQAWLGALAAEVCGVQGTVAESSCGARGGRSCMHTVMWQEPASTERLPLDPPDATGTAQVSAPTVLVPPPSRPSSKTGASLAPVDLQTGSVAMPSPWPLRGVDGEPKPEGSNGADDQASQETFVVPHGDPVDDERARTSVPISHRWSWLRRRAWLVAIGLLAGCLGGFYASSKAATTYSATSVLVVQANGATAATSSANGAEALAVTYAALIPDDQSLLHRVAGELGVPETSMAHSLAVQSEAGTALVDIHFSAADPATARRGANDVARLLSSANPPGRAIAAGSVAVVSPADSAPRSGTLHKYGLPLGVLGGLVVGAGAALVAERTDRRVDDLSALGGASDCSATVVPGGLTAAELARSLQRSGGSCVTIVPIRAEQHDAATVLASAVRDTWPVEDKPVQDKPVQDKTEPLRAEVPEVFVSRPYFDAPQSVSTGSGQTVLVVGAGERAAAVREVIERLRLLGRGPIWAVLDRAGQRRAGGRAR
jgi:capsular polysaccharide biosynthesis protein